MTRASVGWGMLISLCLGGALPASAEAPVQTVSSVDLKRYVGTWYEVAKIPNRFQDQCTRGTTATYSLLPDGRIKVVNACYKENGKRDEADGVARIVDSMSNARLEVSFVSLLGWRPFWGDYWIMGLDPEYRWVVIGTPDRKYGWILARTPTPPAAELAAAFAVLTTNGYRREDFALSPP